MPVDMKLLERHGVSAAAYKKIWTLPYEDYPPKIKRLVNLISARVKDGRQLNLKEWRAYHAIDLAYDVPFDQTTPTLVHNILAQGYPNTAEGMEGVLGALKNFGLSKETLFMEVALPDGQTGLALNPPIFFQIFIPLVKAYVTIRTASIFSQLNQNPLLPYLPLKNTDRNKVLCEIITDTVDTISHNYGYAATLRQAIQHMLKYGLMLTFPREEWDCQYQLFEDEFGVEKKVTVKEGIRYLIPHPTRMFFDLKYPLTSINTDTGCEFAGTWHVTSYGEVLDNRDYWNRKSIFAGTNWFLSPYAGNYFNEVYPCQMQFLPVTNAYTREDKAAWYSSGDRDKAVFLTDYFQKLVPRDWGLGDYKYPVWHRFTLAGDDTVIWCSPCAYTPSWFMGYDYDENAGRNSSMGLELIPWQDQLGNVLSQMILTAKQNLANVIFYDQGIVDKEDVAKLQNLGERKYRETQWIGYDSMKNRIQGLNVQNAFNPVQFARTPIQELLQLIPSILNIMERVLQITAQEAGSAASHQQSKFEIQQTGGAASTRVNFTKSYVDEGIDAWMHQLYDGSQEYLDIDVTAQVSADIPNVQQILQEIGFDVKHSGEDKLLVAGKKTKLRVTTFTRSGEAMNPAPDKEQAAVIFQLCATLVGQEQLFKEIGSKNIVAMLEFAAQLGGAPRGFKLKTLPPDQAGKDEAPAPNIMQAIQAAQQATMQAIEEKLGKPVAQEMGKVQGEVQQLQQVVKQLEGIYKVAQSEQDKARVKAAETQQAMQIKEAEFQAEQKRQQEAHALKMQQEAEKARLQQAITVQKAHTETAVVAAKTQAEIEASAKKADAAAKAKPAKP